MATTLSQGCISQLYHDVKVKHPIVQIIEMTVVKTADPNAPKRVKYARPALASCLALRPALRRARCGFGAAVSAWTCTARLIPHSLRAAAHTPIHARTTGARSPTASSGAWR